MSLTRWEPFRELVALRNAFDRLIDEPLARRGDWLAALRDVPAMNMYDVNGSVAVDIALPGVKPEEVEINVTGNTLVVKGEHREKEEVNEEDYYRREVHYGSFTRTIEFPMGVDIDKIEAKFEDGVLKIVAPKLPEAHTKRVEIKQ
jgi:HSP20 family protein